MLCNCLPSPVENLKRGNGGSIEQEARQEIQSRIGSFLVDGFRVECLTAFREWRQAGRTGGLHLWSGRHRSVRKLLEVESCTYSPSVSVEICTTVLLWLYTLRTVIGLLARNPGSGRKLEMAPAWIARPLILEWESRTRPGLLPWPVQIYSRNVSDSLTLQQVTFAFCNVGKVHCDVCVL